MTHPLTVIISTAGEGTGELAWDLWDYSHKVAAGEIDDPTFAPIIFAAPPDADWRDEAGWRAANPAIEAGFCSIEELRIKARRIEHFPAEIADFKRFHLDIWQEAAAEPWLALEVHDQAEEMTPADALEGRPCWIGIDLSSVEDLTAVVAVRLLFAARQPLGSQYPVLAKIEKPDTDRDAAIPAHPGAAAFLDNDQKTFFDNGTGLQLPRRPARSLRGFHRQPEARRMGPCRRDV